MPLFFTSEKLPENEYDAMIAPNTKYMLDKAKSRIDKTVFAKEANGIKRYLLQLLCENCLNIAIEKKFKNIMIPLDDFNLDNITENEVFKIVEKTIVDFLQTYDMNVFLLIWKRSMFEVDEDLFKHISNLVKEAEADFNRTFVMSLAKPTDICHCCKSLHEKSLYEESLYESEFCSENIEAVEEMVNSIEDNFVVSLLKLIDSKNMTDVECYKKANVSKQTWYKILNKKDYRPSKNTVIAFAVSLGLNYSETQHLLSTAGFALSNSSKFDIIIQYFIINKIYDIFKINEMLFRFGEPCLGLQ